MTFEFSKEISARYGRKAGLLRHCLHMARYRFGLFHSLEQVRWEAVTRLVFVCKGNICRSAYAEWKAKSLHIKAASFGLEAKGNSPADEVAMRIATARGVDLTMHRASSLDAVSLGPGDLLLTMESWQVNIVERRAFAQGAQITLVGLWCKPVRPHIEDPSGLSPEYFSNCFSLIDDALNRLSLRLTHADAKLGP